MNTPKILIVEDDVIISKQLSNYLQKRHYQITGQVTNGEDALELIKEDSPDIILMDIELDGKLDGVETAAIIQETLIIPIIYLTNYNDSRTFNRAKGTLPATYLTKPYKNHDVKNAIEMAISSLSLLTQDKKNDVNLSLEITLKNEDKAKDELFILKDRIFIRNNNNDFNKLEFDHIIYIKSDNHSLDIHTLYGVHKINYSFNRFLELFNDYPIFRIHRQFAVNANYVTYIRHKDLKLEYIDKTKNPGETKQITLAISQRYKESTFSSFRVTNVKK